MKDIRNQAVVVAVRVAQDIIAKQTDVKTVSSLIDSAIVEVGAKLH